MYAFVCGRCGLPSPAFTTPPPVLTRRHAPPTRRAARARPTSRTRPARRVALMRTSSESMPRTPEDSPLERVTSNGDSTALDGAAGLVKSDDDDSTDSPARARFKTQRRILTGVVMGAVVIGFVFGGRWPFLCAMLVVSLLGQGEYYRMVAAKGHLPAHKCGLAVTSAIMIASAVAPNYADVMFPLGGTIVCIYLLFRRRRIATIADISTTFMGLFYAGYLPSFWIRMHGMGGGAAAPLPVARALAALPLAPVVTPGALLVFWTWLAGVSADIGAFFFGRTYGRTRLSNISPKKTVEGAVAGFVCSAGVSVLGAYLLQWPLWYATGAVYGVMVGVVGLCGDLFESCFKRDVGWKDSGSLFPGHGGILDRADSLILIAPLVYFFATIVLPVIATRVG